MSIFALANAYKSAVIDFPELKEITLAQWILESGRGTSYLAKNFFNFGGLKYRTDKVTQLPGVSFGYYDELRGEEDKYYFKCDSEATYIKLYWAFMERAIYKGWRAAAQKGPEAFLQHIVYAGYLGGSTSEKAKYIEKIKKLIPEARTLLKGASEVTTKKYTLEGVSIAFDCGHGYDSYYANKGDNFDSGAVGNGAIERDEVIFYVEEAAKKLRELGAKVSVFKYTNKDEKRYSLGEKSARAKGHTFFVSCHLNASEKGLAQGTEVLYVSEKYPGDVALAKELQKALVNELGFHDRGIKLRPELGVLKSVPVDVNGACLVEPFFIDDKGLKNKETVRALCYKVSAGLVNGLIARSKALGLGKEADVQAPAPIEPTNPPAPIEPTKPDTTTPGKHFLRLTSSGEKDAKGLIKFNFQLCQMVGEKNFKIKETLSIRSGVIGAQALRTAAVSKAGTDEPIPEGYYALRAVEWKDGKGNYNASWGAGMGATWTDIIPKMVTARSALGVHLDTGTPGTLACIGLQGVGDEKKYVAWRELYPEIDSLTVNYYLKTVETNLTKVEEVQADTKEEVKPPVVVPDAPVEEVVKPKSFIEKLISWFLSLFKKES